MEHVRLMPVLICVERGIFFFLVFDLVQVFAGWLYIDIVSLGEVLSLFNSLLKHLLHEFLIVFIIIVLLIVIFFIVVVRVSSLSGVRSTIGSALILVIDIFPSFFSVFVTLFAIRIINKLAIFVVFKLSGPLSFEALEMRVAELGPLCIVHVAHGSLKCLFLSSLVNLGSHQLLITLVTLLRVGESLSCLFLIFKLLSISFLFNIKKSAIQSHLFKLNSHINYGSKVGLGCLVA